MSNKKLNGGKILDKPGLERAEEAINRLNKDQSRRFFREGQESYLDFDLCEVTGIFDALSSGLINYKFLADKLGFDHNLKNHQTEALLNDHPLWVGLRAVESRGERSHTTTIDGKVVTFTGGADMTDQNLRELIKLNLFQFLQSPFEATRAIGVKLGLTYLSTVPPGKRRDEEWLTPDIPGLLESVNRD